MSTSYLTRSLQALPHSSVNIFFLSISYLTGTLKVLELPHFSVNIYFILSTSYLTRSLRALPHSVHIPLHIFRLSTRVIHKYIDLLVESSLHDPRRLIEEGLELFCHHNLFFLLLAQLNNYNTSQSLLRDIYCVSWIYCNSLVQLSKL